MRLIDADAFLKSEIERCGCVPLIGSCTHDNEIFKFILESQPTVDATTVVRCKDCKHWGTGISAETDKVKCCEYARYMVGENGYCVYGEKGGKK